RQERAGHARRDGASRDQPGGEAHGRDLRPLPGGASGRGRARLRRSHRRVRAALPRASGGRRALRPALRARAGGRVPGHEPRPVPAGGIAGARAPEPVRGGRRLDECAVLYRTNAQSRALETELRMGLVPYQIVGGVAFYQRREVKDLIAYLRLVANPADAVSFWRVWNTPRRGLGDAVRARVEACMAKLG